MFNDGNRVYPVDKLIMHHAVSDDMVNWDDLAVQDWFSNIGKDRGYSGGAVFSYHEHPGRPGQATYSMAHYCLHRYTKDGNKYGWRLTELIKNPFQQVAWHCGNWGANQTSIGIETAGNYSTQDLDDKALMLVAQELGKPWDQELVEAGYPSGVNVYGHKDWFATACPGQIYNELDKLIDMINNPAKWENILWPPAPPAPVVTTKEETKKESVPFTSKTVNSDTLPKGESKVTQAGVNGERTIVYTVTLTDGKETNRIVKSNNITTEPVDEITTVGTYEKPADPPVEEPPVEEPNNPDNGGKEDEMSQEQKNAQIEAAKVVGRNGILAGVSALLASLANWGLAALVNVHMPADVFVALGGLLYAGSLYVDKVIHEKAKTVETKVNGLVGF